MSQSLGLLEVTGLLPAVTVADAMVKTANVRILAVEAARGNGWMTVKIEGSVDAVNAAINAGVAIAKKMSVLVSKKVIARPDEAVFRMFGLGQEVKTTKGKSSIDTDAMVQAVEKENMKVAKAQNEEVTDHVVKEINFVDDEVSEAELQSEEITDHMLEEATATHNEVLEAAVHEEEKQLATCNLCMDPRCTRKKGEFKTSCLHYVK